MTRRVLLALLLAGAARAYTVEVIQAAGDPANRVDLAILGDGYRDVDQTQLTTDANDFLAQFWAETPFAQYRNYFNVKLVHVISNDNGADNGTYGAVRDTALGAFYNCNGIDRLLCADSAAVYNAAGTDVPEYDYVVVVVNDPKYGGSGGSYSVFSINSSSGQIGIHEFGHTSANLADEYEDPYPGYPPCSGDCPEPNATLLTDRALVKWTAWIDGATPVPTPETPPYVDAMGVYEGARYETTGVYRPKQDCLMRTLDVDFCSVCAEAEVLATYDIVDPIDSATPPSPIVLAMGDSSLLAITRPAPIPDTVTATWTVDGVVEATGQDSFLAQADVLGPGNHDVVAATSDDTTLVRNDPAGLLLAQRSFTITVCEGGLDPGGTNACGGVCELLDPPTVACDGADTDLCADDAFACAGPNATACSAGADNGDACDGTDNDCDGTPDDDGSNACGGSCALAVAPGVACDGPDTDLCADDTFACTGPNATACPGGADNGDPCDGADNDCDGAPDNDGSNACSGSCALDSAPGLPCDGDDTDLCADDLSECAGLNTIGCAHGADNGDPCNGLDDDCDGTADDDGLNGCGGSCALDVAPGLPCDGPDTDLCSDDLSECAGPNTTTCSAGDDDVERCDGHDNDCDGETDEGFGLGDACTAGIGACERAGVRVCGDSGTSARCNARAADPAAETCNSVDDDCDGTVDNPADSSCQATSNDSGCGCRISAAPRGAAAGLWVLALLALVPRRGSRQRARPRITSAVEARTRALPPPPP